MTKQQVWERLQLIIRRIQIGVVLAVGILIILWTVPIARGWLISLSIFDNDSIIPIIGTAFILTFGAIVDLQRNSFKMKK